VLRKKSNRDDAVSLSERQFRFGCGNTISSAEARNLYHRFAIPGPGRSRSPLIVGGGKD